MALFNSQCLPARQNLYAYPLAAPLQPSLSSPSRSRTTATSTSASYQPKKLPGKRHHRTATPEQRQIRAIFKAPVYTIGIDPQADRGLLSDFSDAIQIWANTYTISIRTLSLAQIRGLLARPEIATCLGTGLDLANMAVERDLLSAVVAAIVSRFVVRYALGEDALALSGHVHGNVTSHLARLWHQLAPHDIEGRAALLHAQKEIYTSIKSNPDYISWRSLSALQLSTQLITILSGLLNPLLPPHAIHHRNNVLQDLFVKAYRINFRLRMEPAWWGFAFRHPGDTFESGAMVNASRGLYGDVVRTMMEVSKAEEEHVVAVSTGPVVVKREVLKLGEYGMGMREEVVLKGVVHIRRG